MSMLLKRTLVQKQKQSAMSIQKPSLTTVQKPSLTTVQKKTEWQPYTEIKKPAQLKEVQHRGVVARYHQVVQHQFEDGVQNTGCIYILPLPAAPANMRTRHLVIKNVVYLISNWTSDQFPNVIYICLDQYDSMGYKQVTFEGDAQGNPVKVVRSTDKIAALQLQEVNPILDDSGVRTYELKYCLKDSVYWNIFGLQVSDLKFKIKTDDNIAYQSLPLPNPLTLNLQIRMQ